MCSKYHYCNLKILPLFASHHRYNTSSTIPTVNISRTHDHKNFHISRLNQFLATVAIRCYDHVFCDEHMGTESITHMTYIMYHSNEEKSLYNN